MQKALGELLRGAGALAGGAGDRRGPLEKLGEHRRQRQPHHFHFCPDCGSDVHYEIEGKFDGLIAIPLGAFEDPYFASPRFSVWEERKHDWVEITGDVDHSR